MEKNVTQDNSARNTETGSLKSREIDSLDLKFHLSLLGVPLLLICFIWIFFNADLNSDDLLKLLLICNIYILGYSLSYYLHQARLNRLW
ncbi:hypothetical protein HWQ46_15810 [Shewanella sp. D64]|nr:MULTISPECIES: hypothetical protein [unclassified Shewanella]MEC4727013.1 hypothetical protein [Shewanella sp. D64]MEC4737752.1 hypothetical protein [Shewanella sp. E94]WBJ93986.1 hypothetical protein HWQ47_18945 [Shewanella sp. MTB7]